MSGISTIYLVSLSIAIAKHIVKVWLKNDLVDAVLEEWTGIINDNVKEDNKKRPSFSDADQIGEALATRMRAAYGHSKLPGDSKSAVAQEIALTLAKANLSLVDIFDDRFDPRAITARLRRVRPDSTKLFSVDETSLYDRLLFEAAEAMVQISGVLQSFPVAFAQRALEHHEQLTSLLEKALSNPDAETQAFQNKYTSLISSKLDKLEVFGLRQLDRYSMRQSLSAAYISLSVGDSAAPEPSLGLGLFKELLQAPSHGLDKLQNVVSTELNNISRKELIRLPVAQKAVVDTPTSGSIESVLFDKKRVVVQGQAGSGKTTLMQWLAVRAASNSFHHPLTSWNNTVPFFIRLREHLDHGFPAPEAFIDAITPMLASNMPRGWVSSILDVGRGLVLVDGVDELPVAKRGKMLERLAELVKAYPMSRYVISSRPGALKGEVWPEWETWLDSENFATTSLREMDIAQVDAFVDRWHNALADGMVGDELSAALSHASSLKILLASQPLIRRLAKTPLLCGMICALYQDRLQSLPSERIKLYDECVEMLLMRRDEGRRIAVLDDYPTVSLPQRLTLLQDLAYWMLINDYSDVSEEEAISRFARKLPSLNLGDVDSKQLLRLFVDRTNLLREPAVGRIGFTHLTFQEYLAAKELIEENSLGLLLENADNDRWRETLVVAAGIARQNEREGLLKSLTVKSHDVSLSPAKRKRIALVALASLETSVSLSPELREEVLENSAQAIPPSDQDEIIQIALAGDAVVELLRPQDAYTPEECIACIRTLARIGSEKALIALAEYTQNVNVSVRQELLKAREGFDQLRFAEVVFPRLDWIAVYSRESIVGLEHAKDLASLYLLDEGASATLVQNIPLLPNLRNIYLRAGHPHRYFGLTIPPSVRNVTAILERPLSEYSFLRQSSSLTHLEVFMNVMDFDVKAFVVHERLRNLLLASRQFSSPDLSGLKEMATLRVLRLLYGKDTLDPESLSGISQLAGLHIAGLASDDLLGWIRHLQNLRDLTVIARDGGVNVVALSPLKKLRQLAISVDSETDLDTLASLSNLKSLKIVCKESLDARRLTSLEQLVRLDLSACEDTMNLEELLRLPDLVDIAVPVLSTEKLDEFRELTSWVSIHRRYAPFIETFGSRSNQSPSGYSIDVGSHPGLDELMVRMPFDAYSARWHDLLDKLLKDPTFHKRHVSEWLFTRDS